MGYDPKVPLQLKETQQWFGTLISRAIDDQSRIQPITPSGKPVEEEAGQFIKPSPTLRPVQRLQIYNQQYWWRLLSILHEIFPLVVRLFGYYEFNRRLGTPYLLRYPPNSWSLNGLGDRLLQFLEETYHDEDRALVLHAVELDNAFSDSFLKVNTAPILLENLPVPNDPSSLFEHTLYLQPHLYLLKMPYDLCTFREEFLKESVEHWMEQEFPPLKKEKMYYFAVYRNPGLLIQWIEISLAEWSLLNQFRTGATIEAGCEWLETQDTALQEEAFAHLHKWFQGWIVRRWLTLESICT